MGGRSNREGVNKPFHFTRLKTKGERTLISIVSTGLHITQGSASQWTDWKESNALAN
jgi:hypothetical protein